MPSGPSAPRSEEHTSELQSHSELVCRLLLEKKKRCWTTRRWSKTTQAGCRWYRSTASHTRSSWAERSDFARPASPQTPLIFPFFFFNDNATTEIYTLPLHDALPIFRTTFVAPVAVAPLDGRLTAGPP